MNGTKTASSSLWRVRGGLDSWDRRRFSAGSTRDPFNMSATAHSLASVNTQAAPEKNGNAFNAVEAACSGEIGPSASRISPSV